MKTTLEKTAGPPKVTPIGVSQEAQVEFFSSQLKFVIAKKYGELPLSQVAKKTGFSENSLYLWTSGRHLPQTARLLEICQIFRYPPDFFFIPIWEH